MSERDGGRVEGGNVIGCDVMKGLLEKSGELGGRSDHLAFLAKRVVVLCMVPPLFAVYLLRGLLALFFFLACCC